MLDVLVCLNLVDSVGGHISLSGLGALVSLTMKMQMNGCGTFSCKRV